MRLLASSVADSNSTRLYPLNKEANYDIFLDEILAPYLAIEAEIKDLSDDVAAAMKIAVRKMRELRFYR